MTFNYFICILLIIAATLLTACGNTENTEFVTVNSTVPFSDTAKNTHGIPDDETSAELNNTKMQAENDICEYENILKTYSQLLMGLLAEEPMSCTVTDMEAPAALISTDIGFIDTNADNIPELIVGAGHGTNGINKQFLYNTDGTLMGEFSTNKDGTVFVDGSWYAIAQSSGYVIYTKLCDGMPLVYLDWRSDETYGAVYVKQTDSELRELGELSYADAAKVVSDNLGVSKESLLDAYGTAQPPYICDTLRVPDPENYTEEDIYDCLLSLLQEYEDQEQE